MEAVVAPLAALLDGVLTGMRRDVPGELGTAVTIAHPAPERGGGELQILAATGLGNVLTPVTTGRLWGPSLMAAGGEEPIVTADLWQDARWPHLTPDAVRAHLSPQHHEAVSRSLGVAALPGMWDDRGVVVLSVYLDRPADHDTLAVLTRHERLVTSAITIADVATRNATEANQVLDALASRAVIDQAKGAIMTVRRCDADEAWAVLRRASQEFNIKLRELARALIDHVGHAPGQQPDAADREANAVSRAAALVWLALTDEASQDPLDPGRVPMKILEPENS
ncbi:MAG TPA: ANTAR domain-containing protein [Actinophytocola sp.]|nr:ANTAR domain-containing protein [Actinophytocola sp.]